MMTRELLKYEFCFDSRKIKPGCIFVAIRGQRHDGHDFAREALEKGASFVIVERSLGLDKEIVVANVVDFLIDLARLKLENVKTVVGVTGSSGKTFTKELLSRLIPGSFKNTGNMNTEIGLPISILNEYKGEGIVVLEMGMNRPGDISKLCRIAEPNLGIVLNVGRQHIGIAGSEENIFRGKMEMVDHSEKLVVPHDDPRVIEYVSSSGKEYLTFGVGGGDVVLKDWKYPGLETLVWYESSWGPIFLKLRGIWNRGHLLDLAASMCALKMLDLDFRFDLVKEMEFPEGRFKTRMIRGRVVIDDTYNASLKAFEVAVETMKMLNFGRKFAVVGPIKEQGEYSKKTHERLSRLLEKIDGVFVYDADEESQLIRPRNVIFRSNDRKKLAEEIEKATEEYDVILFKASRSVSIEEVLREFEVMLH